MNLRNLLFTIGVLFASLILNAQNWNEISKVVAPDRAKSARFGRSVAVDGEFAVIGANGECFNENGEDSISGAGAAFVYNLTTDGWKFFQKLVPSTRGEFFYFGYQAVIEGDIIVVSAIKEDVVSGGSTHNDAGAIYIFRFNGTEWIEDGRVYANDVEVYAVYGQILAINKGAIAVGVPQEGKDENGENSINNAGAVYLVEEINNTWQQTKKIVSSDRGSNYDFGCSVDLEDTILVAGSRNAYYNSTKSGVAYVYIKNEAGWIEQPVLHGSGYDDDDYFGRSVSIFGENMLIGATSYDYTYFDVGTAFLFSIKESGITEREKLFIDNRHGGDFMGIAVSADENIMISSASKHDYDENGANYLENAGAVILYSIDETDVLDTIIITASDRIAKQEFGENMAYNKGMLIVGSYRDYRNEVGLDSLSSSGSVYFYSAMPLAADQPQDAYVCIGTDAGFKIGSLQVDSYQWQINEGAGFINITNNATYSGTATDSLEINNITEDMLNKQYRCLLINSYATDSTNIVYLLANTNAIEITSVHEDQIIASNSTCSTSLYDYTVDVTSTNMCGGTNTITQTPVAGTIIYGLVNQINLIVSDELGHVSSVTFTVSINDDEDPVITSTHTDVVLKGTEFGVADLPDYIGDVTATDNCDDDLDLSQSPTPGTVISGSVDVILTVTDESDNKAQTTFLVTVSTTGLDALQAVGLMIYPNPTNGIITIESSDSDIQKITISDISGRIIYENTNPSNNQTIDLGEFKGDMYILTIHTQTNTINTKIIKE